MKAMVEEARRDPAQPDAADRATSAGCCTRAGSARRQLSTKVSTAGIDELYAAALDAGAIGGKLLGAGGGGFLLLFVKPERQAARARSG